MRMFVTLTRFAALFALPLGRAGIIALVPNQVACKHLLLHRSL